MSLIDRLTNATGPDRELGTLIAAACRIVDDFDPNSLIGPIFYVADEGNAGHVKIYVGKISDSVAHHKATRWARPFTASLDAALTLVPEGYHADMKAAAHRKGATALVWHDTEANGHADGATYAIALCIAALRARESGNE